MSDLKAMPRKQTIRVEDPQPLSGSEFMVTLPVNIDEAGYRFVRDRIEARKRFSIQGYDNLLAELDAWWAYRGAQKKESPDA